ncbi:MAG: nuclear transport factor 2 family protein [Bacteroidales bacterium]|nr:MAG: nuclear transport factor 2 family protein [Bacteroidales bacterium]
MKKMMIILTMLAISSFVKAQVDNDTLAIQKAALNYLEGWYSGNVERMDQALHPELAKRNQQKIPNTEIELINSLTKNTMLEYTKAGAGTRTPKDKINNKVKILHIYKGIATAVALSYDYVDYLHLVKTRDGWRIINVLWEMQDHEE